MFEAFDQIKATPANQRFAGDVTGKTELFRVDQIGVIVEFQRN